MSTTTTITAFQSRPSGETTCLGDHQAADVYDYAKDIFERHATTEEAKELFSYALPKEHTIRAWWKPCKKDFNLVRMAIIALKKGDNAESIFHRISNRHALWKTPFLRFLEYRWMKEDREGFIDRFFSFYAYLGLDKEGQRERAEGYALGLEKQFESK
jgi:hypothetical protein